MELFTLGNGAFTEADVVAMARAWTGHNYDSIGEQYLYRANQHDTGQKTLFGITKDWDGPEALTEIVRGVPPADLRPVPQHARSGRSSPTRTRPPPSSTTSAPAFIASGMNVKALLRAVFLRPEFRLATTRTALVRSPVEWMVADHAGRSA